MATRHPKKRRLVTESSEDEEDVPFQKSKLPQTSPPSTTASAETCLVTRTFFKRSHRNSSGNLPVPCLETAPTHQDPAPDPVASRWKPKFTVQKSKPTTSSPRKNPPTHRRSTSLQRPPLSSSQSRQFTASQHEDLDDLIEDISSDDAIGSGAASTASRVPIGPTINFGSQATTNKNSVGGISSSLRNRQSSKAVGNQRLQTTSKNDSRSSTDRSHLELRGPAFLTLPQVSAVAKAKTVAIGPRPWPERFAPKSPADLAVHPKKVSEVRTWLEHVLNGLSKQRLLVLRGSAGTGKTATINVLSNELGFEVLEWKNPSYAVPGDAYRAEGAFSTGLTGVFEEFMGRAGRFSSLEMVSTAVPSTIPRSTQLNASPGNEECRKKIILIEDFPSTLFASSQAHLASFRRTIKSFLAIAPPSRSTTPLPPLVLIITESAAVTGPGAFTAHRLLSPEILHHPLSSSINFNKIAPTFMLKALSRIMSQESHESGRTSGPSGLLMEALSSSGDVRSAIMSLEFLAVNGNLGTFSERAKPTEKKRKKLGNGELNDLERETLVSVTQRGSRLGIFHALGKVIYNKRYGDDIEDPYVLAPPKPTLETSPWKSRASKVDINSLMDEAGADVPTLIAGLHENYIGSCNFLGGFSRRTHTLEDLLDCVNDCLGDLSDSDLLGSPRPYHNTRSVGRGIGGNQGTDGAIGAAGIRQDEISFQVAVRGILMALPSPVKRDTRDNKMFYPTTLKLWRDREEIEGMVDLFVRKFRLSSDWYMGGGGVFGAGRLEMVLERLPYLKTILKGQQLKRAEKGSYGMKLLEVTGKVGGLVRELEQVSLLRGIGGRSEDLPDEDSIEGQEILDELETAEKLKDRKSSETKEKVKAKWEKYRLEKSTQLELEVPGVESLVLADDDIEDE